MASEHFFSWPRDVRALDKRVRRRIGWRMVAAGVVLFFGAGLLASLGGVAGGLGAMAAVVLVGLCLVVSLVYVARGFMVLVSGLFGPEPLRPPSPDGTAATTAAAPGVGSRLLTWLVGAIVLLGAFAAWMVGQVELYGQRPRVSEGLLAASPLRERITEAFQQRGPGDMSCSAARCALDGVSFAPAKGIQSLASDRTGAITIEYDLGFLPQDQRRIVIVPRIGGQEVDLSSAAAAGAGDGPITWTCATARTTVPTKWRPSTCR